MTPDLDKPCDDQHEGSDDEFVVVIPDCFNLEVPLPELASLRSTRDGEEEPVGRESSTSVPLNDAPHGSVVAGEDCGAVSRGDRGDGLMIAGDKGYGGGDSADSDDRCGDNKSSGGCDDDRCGDDGCGDDGCGDDGCGDDGCGDDGCGDDGCGDDGCGSVDDSDAVGGGASGDPVLQGGAPGSGDRKPLPLNNARMGSKFTLQNMTLKRVIDARIKNPLTIATAAIHSAADFVSTGIHFKSTSTPSSGGPSSTTAPPAGDDEEKFEVSLF